MARCWGGPGCCCCWWSSAATYNTTPTAASAAAAPVVSFAAVVAADGKRLHYVPSFFLFYVSLAGLSPFSMTVQYCDVEERLWG